MDPTGIGGGGLQPPTGFPTTGDTFVEAQKTQKNGKTFSVPPQGDAADIKFIANDIMQRLSSEEGGLPHSQSNPLPGSNVPSKDPIEGPKLYIFGVKVISQKSLSGKISNLAEGVSDAASKVFSSVKEGVAKLGSAVSRQVESLRTPEKDKVLTEDNLNAIKKEYEDGLQMYENARSAKSENPQTANKMMNEAKKMTNSANRKLLKVAKYDPELAGKTLAESNIHSDNLEDVAKFFMKNTTDLNNQAKLVIGASRQEIKTHNKEEPGSLLRGKSMGARLLGEFNNRHIMPKFAASEKLKAALQDLPKENLRTMKDGKETITTENGAQAEKAASAALEAIREVLSGDDDELQAAFKILQEVNTAASQAGFPPKTGEAVAMNLIFLRGVSIAIGNPQQYEDQGFSVKYENEGQQKNAVLVSKIMQQLANETPFNPLKGDLMTEFNGFLTSKQGVWAQIKATVIPPTQNDLDPNNTPTKLFANDRLRGAFMNWAESKGGGELNHAHFYDRCHQASQETDPVRFKAMAQRIVSDHLTDGADGEINLDKREEFGLAVQQILNRPNFSDADMADAKKRLAELVTATTDPDLGFWNDLFMRFSKTI